MEQITLLKSDFEQIKVELENVIKEYDDEIADFKAKIVKYYADKEEAKKTQPKNIAIQRSYYHHIQHYQEEIKEREEKLNKLKILYNLLLNKILTKPEGGIRTHEA
jgi:hypothetical protein